MAKRKFVGVPAVVLLMAAACAAQQSAREIAPNSTLHVSAHLVPISTVVLDRNGQPATGLTKDDFTLKQDGKEQAIRYFAEAEALPLRFAVLVDVSASQSTLVEDESRASDVFFETMLHRGEDRAMLVQFDTLIEQLQPMTNDPALLHGALRYLKTRHEAVGGTRLIDAVFGVAQQVLSADTGRKAIVLITDGGDTRSRLSLDETIREAQRGNIAIYSICYRSRDAGLIVTPSSDFDAMVTQADRLLHRLSAETGGAVFQVTRDMTLQKILAVIGDRLSKQYEIGYVPPAVTAPNRFHKIELRTKDPHFKVQARTEFFAAP